MVVAVQVVVVAGEVAAVEEVVAAEVVVAAKEVVAAQAVVAEEGSRIVRDDEVEVVPQLGEVPVAAVRSEAEKELLGVLADLAAVADVAPVDLATPDEEELIGRQAELEEYGGEKAEETMIRCTELPEVDERLPDLRRH